MILGGLEHFRFKEGRCFDEDTLGPTSVATVRMDGFDSLVVDGLDEMVDGELLKLVSVFAGAIVVRALRFRLGLGACSSRRDSSVALDRELGSLLKGDLRLTGVSSEPWLL